jgi:hypoxanthine phosphoribosyltransferase
MDALNFLGFAIGAVGTSVGIVGVILTIYYATKAVRSQEQVRRLEGLRKRLDWTEIQTAASDLAQSLLAKGVIPRAFVTPGLNGATFANLLRDALGSSAPVYVGVSHWKEDDPKDGNLLVEDAAAYISLETSKWRVFLPRVPASVASGTVLLVDDLVMSGDFLVAARTALLSSGISRVTTAAIVTTEVASRGKKAPEHSWLTTHETEFYFPWGRSR